MNAAIYARKSTAKFGQKETIENQIKICRRKADELGLNIVDIKTDTGTGTDDINRAEVKELIDDAIKGKYECVIMKGISRLYRDTEKGLGLIKRLDRSGIRVITVEEHFDSGDPQNRTGIGQLDLSRITMYLMFSEMESKKLADRIKFTQIEKAHAGEWNQPGSVPYGYIYNSDTKKLEVDPHRSEITKLIFNLYLNGMGMNSIAHYLNGDNPDKITYPSPKSKRWSEYTIGFILKNRVYLGEVVYNKRSKKSRPYKDPERLGKSYDDIYVGNDYNDREDWIITPNAHTPIIDIAIFDKVQKIIGTKAKRKGVKNNISLLAGIGKCGKCGSGLTFKRGRKNARGQVVTKDNYYCMNYIRYGNQFCTSHHVGSKELEKLVIDDLKETLKERVAFSDATNISTKKSSNVDKDIAKLENTISSLMHKMDVLLEKNMEGKVSDTQYDMFNKRYNDDLELATKQLEQLKIKQSENNDTGKYKKRLKDSYNEVVNIDDLPMEKQRYILLDLVSKVIIDEGNVEIEYNL